MLARIPKVGSDLVASIPRLGRGQPHIALSGENTSMEPATRMIQLLAKQFPLAPESSRFFMT